MERQQDETYLSFVRRVTNLLEDKKIDFSEWGDSILAEENTYNSDNLRKASYVVSKMLRKLDDSVDVTEDSVKKELEELRDTIYKERVKLQDANREKNAHLRQDSRTEQIIEEMKISIENMKPISFKKQEYSFGTGIEASVLVSDIHYGIVCDNIKNYYDEEICIERLAQLRDKTVSLCKTHKVDKLNVAILGDDISGIIHNSTISENNRDVITQIMEVSEILANFVASLAEEIPNVKVFSTFGNHSRTGQGKANQPNKENFERLVPEFLRLRLAHLGIKVIGGGYEDFIQTKIGGRTIVMTHGDKDSLNNVANSFTKLLDTKVDEIYMAHYHAHQEKDDCGTQVVINGSLVSTDSYAMSIRKHTLATQLLRIYGEDVCCYKLTLD